VRWQAKRDTALAPAASGVLDVPRGRNPDSSGRFALPAHFNPGSSGCPPPLARGPERGLSRYAEGIILWPMKLRLDLLEQLSDQDILEEVLANNHRYKPEANFSKTGVGSLSSASIAERTQEEARSTARIQKAMQRLKRSGGGDKPKSLPSTKP
jgi:hypothetical protein